ncbi:MAG: 50S ribosomal protein L34e [Desulfurococcaceae archaeon]
MTARAYKPRTSRIALKRTPSGALSAHYEGEKPDRAKCAICGKELQGVPALRSSQVSKLAKTEKRPERPYGGMICHQCLKRGLKEASRALVSKTR